MENNTCLPRDSFDKASELKDKPNQEGAKALYAQVDPDRQATLANARKSAAGENSVPGEFSFIPPYMLEHLARANGNKGDFAQTYERTREMESHRGARPAFADGDFGGAREVYDAGGKETQPGTRARFEGEPATGKDDVDKAYDYTGIVRDFYLKEFNRNSIDGQGMKYVSTVNFGHNFENAFWDGHQMTYGRPGFFSPFKSFMLLDVTGHEITHGVTEKESNFHYFGQSGALNESLSDVFGEMIKQYAKNQTVDQADWLVGDGIFKNSIHGKAIRDMLHPGTAYDDLRVGKDPQPDNMKNYNDTSSDNFGVHINSGIPNRAFALFAIAVGGHSWEDAGHIWYEARKQAGDHPTFASFAYQTIEAAKKIGHQPEEVEKLQKAWEAVGVTPSQTAVETTNPEAVPCFNSFLFYIKGT